MAAITKHNQEIQENRRRWDAKPVLQRIYADFYERIIGHLHQTLAGPTVELGSGIGNLKAKWPQAICTDLFPNPWLDQIEDVYRLTFPDNTVANFVLFDVFHHLQFPGDALNSLHRALRPGGRVLIFEPYISLVGLLAYGLGHQEPVGLNQPITWLNPYPQNWQQSYYAAQGNATRIFYGHKFQELLPPWKILHRERITSFAYLGSGGYSGRQLYPDFFYPLISQCDAILGIIPRLFACRMLVVLAK